MAHPVPTYKYAIGKEYISATEPKARPTGTKTKEATKLMYDSPVARKCDGNLWCKSASSSGCDINAQNNGTRAINMPRVD